MIVCDKCGAKLSAHQRYDLRLLKEEPESVNEKPECLGNFDLCKKHLDEFKTAVAGLVRSVKQPLKDAKPSNGTAHGVLDAVLAETEKN